MSKETIQGLAAARALFKRFPEAAREEMGVELAIIARDVLALQQLQAPKDTGELEASLSLQTALDELRVRVGLLGGRGSGKKSISTTSRDAFYGRIVNFGRKGRPVVVTRRIKSRKIKGNVRYSPRRVIYLGASDRLRLRGPNKGTRVGSPYKLRVKARAAVHFIDIGREEEALVADRIARFWSNLGERVNARAFG